MRELQEMKIQMNQLRAKPQEGDEDEVMETGAEEEPATWADVQPRTVLQASVQGAQDLVERLRKPPPLEQLREAEKHAPRYDGVPVAPAARKHRVDLSLWGSNASWSMP